MVRAERANRKERSMSDRGRWDSKTLKLRMLTGKAKGLTFELPDIDGVIEHHGEIIEVVLPGMQGHAIEVPQDAARN